MFAFKMISFTKHTLFVKIVIHKNKQFFLKLNLQLQKNKHCNCVVKRLNQNDILRKHIPNIKTKERYIYSTFIHGGGGVI